ncbi:MAG: hypothetical protein QHI38_13655 [Armatimonadota bacterium]|nr:hypothetical protein [Armatimonadota bacterium]
MEAKVFKRGYRIVDAVLLGESYLEEGVPHLERPKVRVIVPKPNGPKGVRRYNPLDEERLFLKFAHLDGDEKGILKFANRYGLLFQGSKLAYKPEDAWDAPIRCLVEGKQVPESSSGQVFGEWVEAWRQQICDVKAALTLWQCIKKNDNKKLQEYIFTSPDEKAFRLRYSCNLGGSIYHTAGSITIEGTFRPELFADLEKRSGFPSHLGKKPARMAIQQLVNYKLRGHCAVQYQWNKDFSKLVAEIVPLTLLGAIWFQLGAEVTEIGKITLCQECGTLIDCQRSTRKFCSDRCRKRFARRQSKEPQK